MLYTIKTNLITEQIINKSRFITSLFIVRSVEEANEILKQTRKTYYNATHNCYAYIIGPLKNTLNIVIIKTSQTANSNL